MPSELKLTSNSYYIPMRDSVRIAASIWLTAQDIAEQNRYPVVLITTRYWRELASQPDKPEAVQKIFYPLIEDYSAHGYRVVIADARGTGASFGCRKAEVDSSEVDDIGEIIKWVSQQDWCDGRVVTSGTSYSGITTLYSLVTSPPALKVGVCRAPDFDMYRHLFAPGGIVNHWFIDTWGECTAELDANNLDALYSGGYFPLPESGADNVLGVRPVDTDKQEAQLLSAIAEHASNFNIRDESDKLDYIENFWTVNNPPVFSTAYRSAIEKAGTPIVIHCGWHDAATQLGALAMFATFTSPVHAVIGPWNHDGSYHVDPFQTGDGTTSRKTDKAEARALTVESFNYALSKQAIPKRQVDYYTLGENRWKQTEIWPLPNTQMQRWYCSAQHTLSREKPTDENGYDHYAVNPTTTTGVYNRWYAQASEQPVHFPDRREEDQKLLVYDTEPLVQDMEITGHPIVHLYLKTNTEDAQFFVYLETIDPDGRVRLLTEGQLRGIHRKISEEKPPYAMFGPYHSLTAADAAPLKPNDLVEIAFDLLPISVLLKKGQRIRMAIAGADCDTFAISDKTEHAVFKVQRNLLFASSVELPVVMA